MRNREGFCVYKCFTIASQWPIERGCFTIASQKFNDRTMNSKRIYLSPYKKKNGNSKLYLQVLLGRKTKKLFDLDLEWPKIYFDEKKERCLPRDPVFFLLLMAFFT